MDKFNIDGHKMMSHLGRVADWQAGREIYPIYVEISPVGWCNHRCTFCAVDYLGYKKTHLDTQKLKDALLSMAIHEVKSVMFAGEGEPTLHPALPELVRYAKRQGLDVALTTNGSRFMCDYMDACEWIKVSVNAGNPTVYTAIHKCAKDQWDIVWFNIRQAVEYKRKHELKTTIGVQCVLLPENAHTLNELAYTCREVGVDYLVIKPFCQSSLTEKKYDSLMYKQSYEKYLNALSMYASSTFELITRHSAIKTWDEKTRRYEKCLSVPHFWAYVQSNGDVYGCSSYIGSAGLDVEWIRLISFCGILLRRLSIRILYEA